MHGQAPTSIGVGQLAWAEARGTSIEGGPKTESKESHGTCLSRPSIPGRTPFSRHHLPAMCAYDLLTRPV